MLFKQLRVLTAISWCCGSLHAQTFEVASIKPQPWTNEGAVRVYVRGNTLISEHADLYLLVEFAYDLRTDDSQLSGGPAWARRGVLSDVSGGDSSLYQVVAKTADGPPPSIEQFRLMLRALLEGRFRLRIHHEKKDVRIFNLVIAKGGPKFKPSAPDAKPTLAMHDGFRMKAVHAPLSELVMALTDAHQGAGRPVIDKTGLAGYYDFEIEWLTDLAADGTSPSVFAALQEQLGLKLDPGVFPFDTVVIDHAEHPGEN